MYPTLAELRANREQRVRRVIPVILLLTALLTMLPVAARW